MLRVQFTDYEKQFRKLLKPAKPAGSHRWQKAPKTMPVTEAGQDIARLAGVLGENGSTKISFDISETVDEAVQHYGFEDLTVTPESSLYKLIADDVMSDGNPTDVAMELLNKVEQEGGQSVRATGETEITEDEPEGADSAPAPEAGMNESTSTSSGSNQASPNSDNKEEQSSAEETGVQFEQAEQDETPINAGDMEHVQEEQNEEQNVVEGKTRPEEEGEVPRPLSAASSNSSLDQAAAAFLRKFQAAMGSQGEGQRPTIDNQIPGLRQYLVDAKLAADHVDQFSKSALAQRLGVDMTPKDQLAKKRLAWFEEWYAEQGFERLNEQQQHALVEQQRALEEKLRSVYQTINGTAASDEAVGIAQEAINDNENNSTNNFNIFVRDGAAAYKKEEAAIVEEMKQKIAKATAEAKSEAEKKKLAASIRQEQARKEYQNKLDAQQQEFAKKTLADVTAAILLDRNTKLTTTKDEMVSEQQHVLAKELGTAREKHADALLTAQKQLANVTVDFEIALERDNQREIAKRRQFELLKQRNDAKQAQAAAMSQLAAAKVEAATIQAKAQLAGQRTQNQSVAALTGRQVNAGAAVQEDGDRESAAEPGGARDKEREGQRVDKKKQLRRIGSGAAIAALLCSLGFGVGYAVKPVSAPQNSAAYRTSKAKEVGTNAVEGKSAGSSGRVSTVSAAGKKTLQDYLSDKDYLGAATAYPGQEALAKIENAIYRNNDLEGLQKYNKQHPSKIGTLDAAILAGKSADVVSSYHALSDEQASNLDRTQLNAIKVALIDAGKTDEATQIFGRG